MRCAGSFDEGCVRGGDGVGGEVEEVGLRAGEEIERVEHRCGDEDDCYGRGLVRGKRNGEEGTIGG